MDIFSTAQLNAVADNTEEAVTPILDMFFPDIEISDKEEIKFDNKPLKRRLSPFVAPFVQGKVVKRNGFKTETFTPAYIKDKRVFEPSANLKRRAGEPIGGTLTPAQRLQAAVADEIADMKDMRERRLETMAMEILRTGKVTVKGEGFGTVVVDFGRNANHTVTLAGAAAWDQAGVSPLANIKTWSSTVLKNSGKAVTDVIMDTLAYASFTADQSVKDALDIRRGAPAQAELAQLAELGLQFNGTIGNTRYWTYQNWYEDPDTGTETSMIPDNTVILVSKGLAGVRHFGAIKDIKSQSATDVSGNNGDGSFSRDIFIKSWDEEDPSVRYLMGQSAPLLVPYFVDATFCVTTK